MVTHGTQQAQHEPPRPVANSPPRCGALLVVPLPCVCLEEHAGAHTTHSSGPSLLTGPLIPPLRQPDSTLVAVSIFLLLTSLTYLLFKLSPRSVLRGVCAHMLIIYRMCVCVNCVCM